MERYIDATSGDLLSPINRCSKKHEKIYQQWFNFADSDGDGRLTSGDVIKLFAKSNLPRPELKHVLFYLFMFVNA
ncbi:hypothetical protein KY289_027116 [Solanum tuberosum]|nr:hypothetical protein KY289_027116 [Solanum tuberosum]KAH0662007.1 hypothetical protein KY284_026938 [Solanum tuberosum]